MKIDTYQMDIEQARMRKTWDELGIDRKLIMRIRRGEEIRPLTVAKLADALEVDPERITVRGDQ